MEIATDAERRQYIRHPGALPIHCRGLRGAHCDAELRNVSQGGICFVSVIPRAPGSAVEITISSPEGPERFLIRVAWCRPTSDGYLLGVRFLDVEDAFRARLVEQVCQIEAYRRDQCALGRWISRQDAASEWIPRHAAEIPNII